MTASLLKGSLALPGRGGLMFQEEPVRGPGKSQLISIAGPEGTILGLVRMNDRYRISP